LDAVAQKKQATPEGVWPDEKRISRRLTVIA
jgi:hypothetical protein